MNQYQEQGSKVDKKEQMLKGRNILTREKDKIT